MECLYVGKITEDPIVLPNGMKNAPAPKNHFIIYLLFALSGGEGDGIIGNTFFNIFSNDNWNNKFKELGLSYTAITENVLKLFLALPLLKLYYHGKAPLQPDEEFTRSKILSQDPIPSLQLGLSSF
jgi:hypothetical protein